MCAFLSCTLLYSELHHVICSPFTVNTDVAFLSCTLLYSELHHVICSPFTVNTDVAFLSCTLLYSELHHVICSPFTVNTDVCIPFLHTAVLRVTSCDMSTSSTGPGHTKMYCFICHIQTEIKPRIQCRWRNQCDPIRAILPTSLLSWTVLSISPYLNVAFNYDASCD